MRLLRFPECNSTQHQGHSNLWFLWGKLRCPWWHQYFIIGVIFSDLSSSRGKNWHYVTVQECRPSNSWKWHFYKFICKYFNLPQSLFKNWLGSSRSNWLLFQISLIFCGLRPSRDRTVDWKAPLHALQWMKPNKAEKLLKCLLVLQITADVCQPPVLVMKCGGCKKAIKGFWCWLRVVVFFGHIRLWFDTHSASPTFKSIKGQRLHVWAPPHFRCCIQGAVHDWQISPACCSPQTRSI